MHIIMTPFSVLKKLLVIIGFLLLGNIVAAIIKMNIRSGFVHNFGVLFDFDREANIPTFYSAMMLFVCAILLFFIYTNSGMKRVFRLQWLLLSILFAFLALDEFAVIHERLIDIMQEKLNLSGYFFYGWVIPYGTVVLLLGFFLVPFLRKLPAKIRTLFLLSAALFLLGAIGMEMIGGEHAETHGIFTPVYAVMYSAEELLEMLGIAFFIYALLTYIVDFFGFDTIHIKVKPSDWKS